MSFEVSERTVSYSASKMRATIVMLLEQWQQKQQCKQQPSHER